MIRAASIIEVCGVIPKFAVVPAAPDKPGSSRHTSAFYRSMRQLNFNIYDNEKKCRLDGSYPTRVAAEAECLRLNGENPQGLLAV